MKVALLITVAVIVYTGAFWLVVLTPDIPHIPFFSAVVVGMFVIPPLGAWWLLFMVVRYEKRVFPTIMLTFVPYGFVWYYFERVRHGTHKSRQLG